MVSLVFPEAPDYPEFPDIPEIPDKTAAGSRHASGMGFDGG